VNKPAVIAAQLAKSGSVDRGTGLVIEWLQNVGSAPDVVARRCVLGKDT